MTDPDDAVDRLRERIKESEELSEADRAKLLDFSDELFLRRSQYSDHRHEKLLRHCTRMAEEVGGLADALKDRDATEPIVRWINRTYDNEETNRDYRVALRVFGRRATDVEDEQPPPSIDWVPSGTSKNYDPAPKPANMLQWDSDVRPMLDACQNKRDAAMIAVAWDSGVRSGEFRDLTVGDVTDHHNGLQITVEGKQGQRTVTLIPSVPYLQQWLNEHPAREQATAPLWSKLGTDEEMSYNGVAKVFQRAADRAGIEKPVTLTNFRKSSASYLASEGVNQPTLEDHHGWTRGSNTAARYVAVFSNASDRELARAHGLDVDPEDQSDDLAPISCPRCGKDTPHDEEFCVWCGQAVEPGAAETMREQEQQLRTAVMRLVQKEPDLLDTVEEAGDLLTVLQNRPDLADDADAFREALRNHDS
jgi:integrase